METVSEVVDVAVQTPQLSDVAVQQGNPWDMVLSLVLVFAVIYVFMVLPNKKRMAEYKKMLDSLQVGNRIMAAGIYGVIKKINENTIEMEVAKGVVIEVSKNTVASVEK